MIELTFKQKETCESEYSADSVETFVNSLADADDIIQKLGNDVECVEVIVMIKPKKEEEDDD